MGMTRQELHELACNRWKWVPELAKRYIPIFLLVDWAYDLGLEHARVVAEAHKVRWFAESCALGSREVQKFGEAILQERMARQIEEEITALKVE